MFDFRYHALSLTAVFLALGIGIVLGVTIGDSLVSEAEQRVRSDLRSDVVEARDRADEARGELARQEEVVERAFPLIVDDRLAGERVAIVAFGELPDDVDSPVREAVEAAGGEIDSTSVFDVPTDERALADAVGGRFEQLGADAGLVRLLGRRIGRSIVAGGRVAQRLEELLGERFRGEYEGADAVVVYRRPAGGGGSEASVAFQEAVIQGLVATGVPVVGVERTGTDPSQVGFYRDADLSSVDNVDDVAGRAALVFALDGARGAFGFKEGADAPLPEPAGAR